MNNIKYLIHKAFVSILVMAFILTNVSVVYSEDTFRAARISDLSGTVKVMKAGGEKEFKGFKGMSLSEGDRITTDKSSWAKLDIDDDKEIKIGESTQIVISELKGSLGTKDDRTGISLFTGKLWTKIKKTLNIRSKYEIKTPTTVMGVRGTQFYVGQEDGSTDVAVLEGTVVATTYVPVEQPDGTGGQQEIETTINQNEQVTLDDTILSQEDVQIEDVTTETLDLFVLETIREDHEGVDQNLLQDIDRVIEERQEEQQQQEEEE